MQFNSLTPCRSNAALSWHDIVYLQKTNVTIWPPEIHGQGLALTIMCSVYASALLRLCSLDRVQDCPEKVLPKEGDCQGINLKGCLYFIGKGNFKISLSKWRVTSKIALHVCIEIFVESAHYHVYHLIDRLLFFAVHFEGFTKNYPFLFERLQNILKGMWRVGLQNKGNSPSILFPDGGDFAF